MEKRFELGYVQSTWWRITDNITGKVIEYKEKEVVKLLNTLHQENQELQEKIMKVKQSNNHYYIEYYKIKEENEELQELNEEIRFKLQQCKNKNKELQKKLDWICEQTGYDGAKFHYIENSGDGV